MSKAKIFLYYCYIAGQKVPISSCAISSQFGSIANLSLTLGYSPYINHLFPFTKIQIFEQKIDNGKAQEPTLEFDGSIIAISRQKNIIGSAFIQLTCLTDGYVWNRRKQYDFYLSEITSLPTSGTGDDLKMRADSQIENFFAECISANKFDVGCAAASVLTSMHSGVGGVGKKREIKSYTYQYNGKTFNKKDIGESTEAKVDGLTPTYYSKVVDKYKLKNKLFGIATSYKLQEYFQQDRFMNLLNNAANDLQGENTFWGIASYIMKYGFYNVYDIPNPIFVKKSEKPKGTIDLSKDIKTSNDTASKDSVTQTEDQINKNAAIVRFDPANNNQPGLVEFLLKPISVLSIPFQCNIIWPDQVIAENIAYDFMNSPTRVILRRQEVPVGGENILLTSSVFAGPIFTNDSNIFSSLLPKVDSFGEGDIRTNDVYSKHEIEYGVNYHRLELSYAFDSTLLKGQVESEESSVKKSVAKNINNFLNYEFSQKYFSSRAYSVQVTPDVDVIPGFPVVVMNKNGEHIVAFCTGKIKTWQADGSKSVQLTLAYPRYYHENAGALGNIVDPTCQDINAIKELCYLSGSLPLCLHGDKIVSDVDEINSNSLKVIHHNLPSVIDKLFDEYQNDRTDGKTIKDKYSRKGICTISNFMEFHDKKIDIAKGLPEEFPNNLFESFSSEASLSTNSFTVYIKKNKEEIRESFNGFNEKKMSCREIVKNHISWSKDAQRI